jgi:hypothetical protein
MANEAGWILRNPCAFSAVWDGTDGRDGVELTYAEDCPPPLRLVQSLFGSGILTWEIPFLFRTPPGWNLLVRGPANWPKDGLCALDGLVETDWSVATFTMNWKITRPEHAVAFDAGEPFCMLVPQRRGELTRFSPSVLPLEQDRAAYEGHEAWAQGRHELQVKKFLAEHSSDFAEAADEWQRQYFRGVYPDGERAPEHQTKLRLREFKSSP